MNVRVQETSPTRRVLEIELAPEEIAAELDRVVADASRRADLPGFRKGKVPRSLLEKRFGASFEQETIERAIEHACRQAFQEQSLVPLAPAEIEDLKYEPGQPLSFKATLEVRPSVTAKDYKGVSVTRRTREIDEADVEREVAGLEASSVQWVDVDRPAAKGDVVVVDHVRVDAKGQVLKASRRRDVEIELGAEGLLPAFEEGLAGAVAGESRTLKVSYPEDFGNAELAGKDAVFHVKIKKIKEKKAHSRDDNWAREIFGVESLEDLKARIRLNLEGESRLASRREVENALVTAILAKNEIEVPTRWVERRVDEEVAEWTRRAGALSDEDRDTIRKNVREAFERDVRREILLDSIASQEGISITDPEVGEEMGRILREGGRLAQEFRSLSPDQRRDRVRNVLERRKVFDFLLEHAQVNEEKASKDSNLEVPAQAG